ncbi:MAG TPA: acyl carrier protein [bacterium]|nr:acyl carrier protein [bacterium]
MSHIDSVRDFIIQELHWGGDVGALTEDYPLIANHVIDSMGLLMLISFLEDELGVDIADDELVPSNFATLKSITSMIDRKRAAKSPTS